MDHQGSPQKTVLLFLSDILFMSFYPSSETWSKIHFACVIRQAGLCRRNAWLHCRIKIHPPQPVWAHCSCITRMDEQLLLSCPPPSVWTALQGSWIYKVRVSSLLIEGEQPVFLQGAGEASFSPWADPLLTQTSNLFSNKPCRKNWTPHCCWLYDLELQPEPGWGTVSSSALFQTNPQAHLHPTLSSVWKLAEQLKWSI